ncbi:extracellular solute-binding protein family 3-like protein [Leptotrombidium deliense]|uniref:Extracellular solute-binding protein family 3-like protein n=1 Tax=Leptotrombidium deliense TaxID=299467 RepID=A0A443SP16_9ACAR|nr:extracellular solute-binding protein family 3-like protein [Leptotrombidium deliense]
MLDLLLKYILALCTAMDIANNTSPVLSAINRNGVLRVGLTGDYAPYSFKTENGEIIGADVIMAQSLADYLGVRLVIVETSWKKLTDDLTENKFDIAMGGISVNQKRAQYGYFSEPLITDGKRPIVRCEDAKKYTTIESMNKPNVRMVVNRGGTNHIFAITHFKESSLTVVEDNRKVFKEIAENRADAMVTDGIEVELQSRHFSGILCPARVAQPFNSFDKAYWMVKDDLFRDKVNEWLRYAKKLVWPSVLEKALSANYE